VLPISELVSPAVVPQEQPAPLSSESAPQNPAQSPAGASRLSPQSQAEADARFQAILNQYGERFSDAQKNELKRLCLFAQPGLDRIRAYPISNGDLPALYLKPLVDRDKKPAATASNTKSPASAKSNTPASLKPSPSGKP
jgi:hypothetical protein